MRKEGYHILGINPVDAQSRGIKDGDIVKVFNDRGALLCAAEVTERTTPGMVWSWEGGWYNPMEPGSVGSIDMGSNVNLVTPPRASSKATFGFIAGTCLVEVERWTG
jgi:anaerobic selenocysteine-containing dehydrogenase